MVLNRKVYFLIFGTLALMLSQCNGGDKNNDLPEEYGDLSVCDCFKALTDDHGIESYDDFDAWGDEMQLWTYGKRGLDDWNYGAEGIYPTEMKHCSGFMRLIYERNELYTSLNECPLYGKIIGSSGESASKSGTLGLIGMYVGPFSSNMINIIIESVEDGRVYGRSVCAGNDRPLSGTYVYEGDNEYYLELQEPGDNKYDGAFKVTVDLDKSKMSGTWSPYNRSATSSTTFSISQRTYRYNPNVGRWPETSKRRITLDELWEYTEEELNIMRNEIFARHGHSFGNRDLRRYFEAQSWYVPIDDEVYDRLSSIERKNVETIKELEDDYAYYIYGRY